MTLPLEDDRLLAAMRWLHADVGLVAEPSAVAGLAALAVNRDRFADRRVATVLTSRNLTREMIVAWLGQA
jgi:threonine dehydratase